MVSNPLSLKTTCAGSLLSGIVGKSSSIAEMSASAFGVGFVSTVDLDVVSGEMLALLHMVFADYIAKSLNSYPISSYYWIGVRAGAGARLEILVCFTV